MLSGFQIIISGRVGRGKLVTRQEGAISTCKYARLACMLDIIMCSGALRLTELCWELSWDI